MTAITNNYIHLSYRTVLKISGSDRKTFLQGIITNDINKVTDDNAIYALTLSPQGKVLYDFFILESENCYWLDIATIHKDAIIKKFSMYKLRSNVEIIDLSEDYQCAALFGNGVSKEIEIGQRYNAKKFCKGIAYLDPRDNRFGARAIIETENNFQSFKAKEFSEADLGLYEKNRIDAKIPEADIDFISGEAFPLDFGLDKLNAIDFKKGCYVGQEVTARVHHKSSPKKAVYKVTSESSIQEHVGEKITLNDNKAGILTSAFECEGLALLRKSDVENATIAFIESIELKLEQ